MEIPNNNINQAIMNAFNNPFHLNSLTQSIMHNINTAGLFQINSLNKQDGPFQSNKTNLKSKELKKYKSAAIESDEDNMGDDNEEAEEESEDNKSNKYKNMENKTIKKKKISKKMKETSNIQTKNIEEKPEDNTDKEGTFVYTDEKSNKYLYAFQNYLQINNIMS